MILLGMCDFPWWLMWLLPLLGFLLGWLLNGAIKNKRINELESDLNGCISAKNTLKGEYDGLVVELDGSKGEFHLLENRFNELSSSFDREKDVWGKERSSLESKISSLGSGSGGGNANSELMDAKADYEKCISEYTELKKEYNALEKKVDNASTASGFTSNDNDGKLSDKKGDLNYDVHAKLKNTNLQIIEGVGPKMEELLKKNGINTWSDLAEYDGDRLRKLLDNENPTKYKIIDPSTWANQATYAAHGKWNVLTDYQKNLDGGKTETLGNTDAKVEKVLIKLGYLKKWKKDDLKAIEGIGPKIESLFHDAGILTWKALSESSVDSLKDILAAAGDRYRLADPGTWPEQARMAHEGLWDKLNEYQDFLQGGK